MVAFTVPLLFLNRIVRSARFGIEITSVVSAPWLLTPKTRCYMRHTQSWLAWCKTLTVRCQCRTFSFHCRTSCRLIFQLVEDTSNALASFKQTLLKLQRRYGGLDEHLAQLTQAQKELGYQRRDVKRSKRCALGEPTDKQIASLNRG